MTTYTSKTPRDLNHDPYPYQSIQSAEIGLDYRVNEASLIARPEQRQAYKLDPRPKFDHIQHNEPNPILVAVRERVDLIDAYRNSVLSGDGKLPHLTIDPRHYDHARKVLTRLANLSQIGA